MRITMKIKHLVITAIAVVAGAFLLTAGVLPQSSPDGASIMSRSDKHKIIEEIRNPGPGANKFRLIRDHIIEHGADYLYWNYDVYTGPGFSTVNQSEYLVDRFTWEEKLGPLLDYVERGPVDGYLSRAGLQLALYYQSIGQLDQAVAILDQTVERFSGDRHNGQQDALLSQKAKLLASEKQNVTGGARITGTVRRADGTPVPGVGIFLRHESIVNRSVIEEDPYQVQTDRRGYFEIDGIDPGSYQLFLGFMFEQIDGYTWPDLRDSWIEIESSEQIEQDLVLHPLMEQVSPVNGAVVTVPEMEFVWTEVEGAAYYNVNIGLQSQDGNGSLSSLLQSRVVGNRYKITLEQLYNKKTGVLYPQSVGQDGPPMPDPYSILGFANTDNRFFWNVEAYDRDGNMITRSNGYRLSDKSIGSLPFFHLKERTMTEADRLLLNGRLKDALAEYEDAYARDPDDVHSLRMIGRLANSNGRLAGDGLETRDDEEIQTNLERLVELDPALDFVHDLAHVYYDRHDWPAYFRLHDTYPEYWDGNEYVMSIYASALLKAGKIEEARAGFEDALSIDPSHRFIGYYVALPLYADADLESALDIAWQYPEHGFGGSGTDWVGLVSRLSEEASRSADRDGYMEQLKQMLSLLFEGRLDQLEQELSESGQRAMNVFVRAVMEVS